MTLYENDDELANNVITLLKLPPRKRPGGKPTPSPGTLGPMLGSMASESPLLVVSKSVAVLSPLLRRFYAL